MVGAETVAQTGEAQAQPHEAEAALRAELHLHLRLRAPPEASTTSSREPEKYEHYRRAQPYSLRIEVHGGEIYGEESGWLQYSLYEQLPGTKGGLWTYRRLVEKAKPDDVQLARQRLPRPKPPRLLAARSGAALQDAKRVSLGFLYWLQTSRTRPSSCCGRT